MTREQLEHIIGELSPFHTAFGYYAQGDGEETATLPPGWRDRLIPVKTTRTRGSTGWCLEVHDLAVSKYAANRPKDRDFVRALVRHGLVDRSTLEARWIATAVEPELHVLVAQLIAADFAA